MGSTGSFRAPVGINIRNILFNKGSHQPFATMAGSTFNRIRRTTAGYRLGFKGYSPDLPNAPNLHDSQDAVAGDNSTICRAWPVIVYADVPSAVRGRGDADVIGRETSPNTPGTEIEVGTLHKNPSHPRDSEVHKGPYWMPFKMLIEALKCFTY